MAAALKVFEKHLERAAADILQYDGWRYFHLEQNWSERKQKCVGEAGMADALFLRYESREILWIEFKTPRGRPSNAQRIWHAVERKRGAMTLIAGQDFEATIPGFLAWYRASGLMRKQYAEAVSR